MSLHPRITFAIPIGLALAATTSACSSDAGFAPLDEPASPAAAAEEPITGRNPTTGHAPDASCTPFQVAYLDRAVTLASAVVHAPAFEACMRDRARRYHNSCEGDPKFALTIDQQVDALFAALRAGQHYQFDCRSAVDQDQCSQQPTDATAWATEDTKACTFGQHWTLPAFDGRAPYPAGDPWGGDVGTVLHEFSHSLGYDHASSGCDGVGPGGETECTTGASLPGCTNCGCGWTRACGGTGTPPPLVPNPGEFSGDRARCAVHLGRTESQYITPAMVAERVTGVTGDPSFPYMLSDCAGQFLAQSDAECDGGLFSETCGPDEILLRTTWSGTSQDFAGTCRCQPAARHLVGFQTGNGHWLQAEDGGGGRFTAEGTGFGPWQNFYLVDVNGGALEHGDVIRIRPWKSDAARGFLVGAADAPDGEVQATVATRSTAGVSWRIEREAGAGRVMPGDQVSLLNRRTLRYMSAWDAGGGRVLANAPSALEWERFVITMPRRALLVNVRTQASPDRYVEFYPEDLELRTNLLAAETSGTPSAAQIAARRQSFWIVDWNGGQLVSGDTISFESSVDGTFWSTCVSGVGRVRGNAIYDDRACQRFRIEVPGSPRGTRVLHRTPINLFSLGTGRYLRPGGAGLEPALTTAPAMAPFRLDWAQGRLSGGSSAARFDVF
jgi:hypothetical protein